MAPNKASQIQLSLGHKNVQGCSILQDSRNKFAPMTNRTNIKQAAGLRKIIHLHGIMVHCLTGQPKIQLDFNLGSQIKTMFLVVN